MISIKGNHISITKGDTGGIVFPFKQKCKAFNLNGWTVRFIVKQKGQPDSSAIMDFEQEIDQDIDTIAFALTTEDTDQTPKDYDWALRITKDEDVQTVAEGIFSITQGVYQ
jgi:hypothetical protein